MTKPDTAPDRAGDRPLQLKGLALFVAMVALAAANFMSFLDMTIANVALPHISGAFGVAPHEGVWAITSYAVAEAITVPLTGWVTSRYGALRIFVVASFAFGLFSLICGLSSSLSILVMARIVQGLAGGFLIPVSQVLLQAIVPPRKANLAVAVWGATALTAPVFGPVLGGLFCDSLGWEWCFFVNVPVAVLCVAVPVLLIPKEKTPPARTRVDYVGLGLLVLWVGALQIMLDTGEQQDWLGSPWIAALGLIAILGLAAFAIWELTDLAPIVDLRVFRHSGFLVATGVMFVAFGCVAAFNVVFVLWLQTANGYPATWAGFAMAFMALLAAAASPVVGFLMSRVDPRILISGGLVVLSASFLSRLGYASGIPFKDLIPAQLALGVGGTFFFLPIMGMALAVVGREEIASASGLFNFARTLSIAFGTALGIALWNRDATANHAKLAGVLQEPDAISGAASKLGALPEQARGLADGLVQTESLMLATNHMFLLLGLASGVAALLIWLAPKPENPLTIEPAH